MPLTVGQEVRNPQDTPDNQFGSEREQGNVACSSYQGLVVENDPNSPLTTADEGTLDAKKVCSTRPRVVPGKQPRILKVDLEPSKEKLTDDHDSMPAAEQETPGSPPSAEQEQGGVGGTPGVVVDKGTILDADKTRKPQKQPRRPKPAGPNPDPKKEAVNESGLPPRAQVIKETSASTHVRP